MKALLLDTKLLTFCLKLNQLYLFYLNWFVKIVNSSHVHTKLNYITYYFNIKFLHNFLSLPYVGLFEVNLQRIECIKQISHMNTTFVFFYCGHIKHYRQETNRLQARAVYFSSAARRRKCIRKYLLLTYNLKKIARKLHLYRSLRAVRSKYQSRHVLLIWNVIVLALKAMSNVLHYCRLRLWTYSVPSATSKFSCCSAWKYV